MCEAVGTRPILLSNQVTCVKQTHDVGTAAFTLAKFLSASLTKGKVSNIVQ
jgi:hypothetical protein